MATWAITRSRRRKKPGARWSLGEIAGDKQPALITLLTDAINARVDEAVASGKISQAKADKVKAETAARVTKLVDVVGRKDLAGKPGGIHPKRGR